MSPRSLTERQKEIQRQKFLQKGMGLLFLNGVRKFSVEDVAKAAGMAKGSFYLYFSSKEEFLFALLKDMHVRFLQQIEQMVLRGAPTDLRDRLRQFIKGLFQLPEFSFFLKNHRELHELFLEALPDQIHSLEEMEGETYARILKLAGMEPERVKPGVVLNYIHASFTGLYGNDLVIDEYIPETLDVLIEGLVAYICQDIP